MDAKAIGQAISTEAAGGAFAAVLGHYLAGGKITFPIFLVIFVLSLTSLKGWGRLVGLIAFAIAAAVVLAIFTNIKGL